MRQDRVATAHPEAAAGERPDDLPGASRTAIEQLAGITSGQGYSVRGERLKAS